MSNMYQLIRTMKHQDMISQGARSMAAKSQTVSGNYLVVGAGESTYDLTFPVIFTDMPAFTFGVRLPPDEKVIPGQMPSVTALMFNWIIEERPGVGTRLYKGCTLGVVANGPIGMKAIVDWSLTGVCLLRAQMGS